MLVRVADLRVGEDDDLAGVGRVGKYFLVSGEGGFEDDLSGPFGGATKTPAGQALLRSDGTSRRSNPNSNHDRSWLFGVRHGEAFERGHTAELLVCGDKHSRKAGSLEPERDRELQRIERAESFLNTMLEEQLPGAAKMLVVHSSHQEPAAAQIGPASRRRRAINTACRSISPNSRLQGKNRLHFHDGKARDEMLGTRL